MRADVAGADSGLFQNLSGSNDPVSGLALRLVRVPADGCRMSDQSAMCVSDPRSLPNRARSHSSFSASFVECAPMPWM